MPTRADEAQAHKCSSLRSARGDWQGGTVPSAENRRERQIEEMLSPRRDFSQEARML
jgi:hypothetical protein